MTIGTYISIITLNVNGLNAPTKRHILIKLTKTKHKGKILKAAREKQQSNIQGKSHTLNSWIFSGNSTGQKGMTGYIYSSEREKSTTKVTVPSKDLIQN